MHNIYDAVTNRLHVVLYRDRSFSVILEGFVHLKMKNMSSLVHSRVALTLYAVIFCEKRRQADFFSRHITIGDGDHCNAHTQKLNIVKNVHIQTSIKE